MTCDSIGGFLVFFFWLSFLKKEKQQRKKHTKNTKKTQKSKKKKQKEDTSVSLTLMSGVRHGETITITV